MKTHFFSRKKNENVCDTKKTISAPEQTIWCYHEEIVKQSLFTMNKKMYEIFKSDSLNALDSIRHVR